MVHPEICPEAKIICPKNTTQNCDHTLYINDTDNLVQEQKNPKLGTWYTVSLVL